MFHSSYQSISLQLSVFNTHFNYWLFQWKESVRIFRIKYVFLKVLKEIWQQPDVSNTSKQATLVTISAFWRCPTPAWPVSQADCPSQQRDFIVFQCPWNQGSLGSPSKQLEQAQQNTPNMIISSWRDHKENTWSKQQIKAPLCQYSTTLRSGWAEGLVQGSSCCTCSRSVPTYWWRKAPVAKAVSLSKSLTVGSTINTFNCKLILTSRTTCQSLFIPHLLTLLIPKSQVVSRLRKPQHIKVCRSRIFSHSERLPLSLTRQNTIHVKKSLCIYFMALV